MGPQTNIFGSAAGVAAWKLSACPNGVPSKMLPHIDALSPSLQRAIQEGKDVNLCTLLIEGYEVDANKSDAKKNKLERKLSQPLNISEFITAFSKYKTYMVEAFPQRQRELDLYENTIIRIHNPFPSTPAFYDYRS